MTPQRLLSLCLWGIIVLLIFPLFLRIAWNDPIDYARGGMGARDFKAYYIAARLLQRGQDIYDIDLQKQEMLTLGLPEDDTLYIYPTFFALILTPLTNLTLVDAARVWNLINVFLLGASLVLLTRQLNLSVHLGRHFPWFVILFLILGPTTLSVRAGQANVLLLFSLVLLLYTSVKDRQGVAGMMLSVPILTKIFAAGFWIWFLRRKKYRLVISSIITVTGILIVSNLILFLTARGNSSDLEYFSRVLPRLAETTANANVQSLRTYTGNPDLTIWVLLGNYSIAGFFNRLDLPFTVSQLFTYIASGVIFLLTLIYTSRSDRRIFSELGFGAMLAMLLLVSSLTWESTLILLIIPFAVLLKAWVLQKHPWHLTLVLLVAYFFLNAGRLWLVIDPSILLTAPWLISLPFLGTLLVWYACVNQSRFEIADTRESRIVQ